jgi:hypothetical protein
MAKCKVKENTDIKLTLSKQDAEVLTSLLGNHIIGFGPNNVILGNIWNVLKNHVDDIGYLPTDGKEDVVYIK